MLTGKEYIRYSRQIMLEQHGERGQEKLKGSCALIIGLGGLGCPTAQYLAAAGVGRLILVDDDQVEASNLHRQILFTEQQIGQPKVAAAAERLQQMNSDLMIETECSRANTENLSQWVESADVIIDCSDNVETRYAINQAAFRAKKPLIIGAAIRFEAQVINFDFSKDQHGCYQCLVPNASDELFNCSTSGVMGPILGIAGSMQALSAIKAITEQHFLHNLWQCFDGLSQKWISVHHGGDNDCPVCGQR